jgi:type III secretory pathway component EscV
LLDPFLEDTLRDSIREGDDGPQLALEPDLAADIRLAVERGLLEARRAGARQAVVLTSAPLRPHVRHLLKNLAPLPAVLAFEELLPNTPIFPFANARVGD